MHIFKKRRRQAFIYEEAGHVKEGHLMMVTVEVCAAA